MSRRRCIIAVRRRRTNGAPTLKPLLLTIAFLGLIALPAVCDDSAVATWKAIRAALMASDGQNYFEMGIKGALLPILKGKVVRLEPATNPTKILLAMEDGAPPEVTLKFYGPFKGKVDAGTKLSFQGVGESFTQSPFMLTLHVDADQLHR